MMRRMLNTALLAGMLAGIVAATGCSPGEAAPAPNLKKAYPKDGAVAAAPRDDRQPGHLTTVEGETVIGRTGPDGAPFEVAVRTRGEGTHLDRRFGALTLELGARVGSPGISQYPCSACHVDGDVKADIDRVADAHHDIQPLHPHETGASCTGCHAPDNVELLVLGSGERATLDHAYRLCAQCHSPQVTDWAAGAHGKRLDGWQGRRVVMGCADCHDPHRPALDRRIPFRPPLIPRSGGRDR
jgi:hypothetical protein